ncbi:hypothetical protein ILYODFUR_015370 [Ilyodon furcidens]|uniref:Uncharacterized protein n=1 Tax=Ilyodon furcidens TaxID=33524 RepID=A0ABV0SXH3_9TELE
MVMEFTRASQVATGIFFLSYMTISQSWWMLETLRSSTFQFRMPYRCLVGFRSGDMLGQSRAFAFSFFSKTVVVLEVCLGSLSYWNTVHQYCFRREVIMLCFSMSHYILAFIAPSMNCSYKIYVLKAHYILIKVDEPVN